MSGSLQTFQFDEIASDIRRPGVYDEIRPRYTNVGLLEYSPRVMVLGQIAAAGATAQVATPYRITRDGQGEGLFGPASQLARMVAAFRAANGQTELWAMGSAAANGAVAATGTITLTGALTQAGTVPVYLGGRRAPAVLAAGQSVTQQAAAVVAAINADTRLPVTAANAAGVVTLTARQAGALGNDLDVRIGLTDQEALLLPTGFGATIVPMAGGAGSPDVTPLLTRIAGDAYSDLAMGWTDTANIGVLGAELARRYNAMVALDMHGYVGYRGSLGAFLSAYGAGAVNFKLLTPIPAYRAGSPPWEWAASLCGVAAFALGNDPARQLKTLALPGIVGPAPLDRFIASEQELLLRNGGSTFNVLSDGTVVLERVVTAYQVSPDNIADAAWLDIMTPKVMTRIRYDWRNYVRLTYPRAKLVDDDSPAAQLAEAVVTAKTLKGSWAGRCRLYESLAWIEGATKTSAEAVFVRDVSDRNRVNSSRAVRIVGNLMVVAESLQFQV